MAGPLQLLLLTVTLASVSMQLRTVRRTGTAGLSATTWLGLLTSTLFWLGYGVATSQPTLITINLPVIVLAATLVVSLVRRGVCTPALALAFVSVPVLGWGIAALTGEPAVLGWGGTALVVGRLVPQLVTAVRAHDRSGISIGAWVGNGSNKIVWTVFGFSIGDGFVAWPSAVAAVVSFAIVALVVAGRTRPRGRRVLVPVPAMATSVGG